MATFWQWEKSATESVCYTACGNWVIKPIFWQIFFSVWKSSKKMVENWSSNAFSKILPVCIHFAFLHCSTDFFMTMLLVWLQTAKTLRFPFFVLTVNNPWKGNRTWYSGWQSKIGSKAVINSKIQTTVIPITFVLCQGGQEISVYLSPSNDKMQINVGTQNVWQSQQDDLHHKQSYLTDTALRRNWKQYQMSARLANAWLISRNYMSGMFQVNKSLLTKITEWKTLLFSHNQCCCGCCILKYSLP